jgi:hypothetical protein
MSNLQTKRIMFKFNNPVIILVLAVLVTGCKKEEILNNQIDILMALYWGRHYTRN